MSESDSHFFAPYLDDFAEIAKQVMPDEQRLFVESTRTSLLRLAGIENAEVNRRTKSFNRRASVDLGEREQNVRITYDAQFPRGLLHCEVHEAEFDLTGINTIKHSFAVTAFESGLRSGAFKYIRKTKTIDLNGVDHRSFEARQLAGLPLKVQDSFAYAHFPAIDILSLSPQPFGYERRAMMLRDAKTHFLPTLEKVSPDEFIPVFPEVQ